MLLQDFCLSFVRCSKNKRKRKTVFILFKMSMLNLQRVLVPIGLVLSHSRMTRQWHGRCAYYKPLMVSKMCKYIFGSTMLVKISKITIPKSLTLQIKVTSYIRLGPRRMSPIIVWPCYILTRRIKYLKLLPLILVSSNCRSVNSFLSLHVAPYMR